MTTGKPCIGLLESHLHNVFARERVPGEDFVYTPSSELFNILEDFCDDQQIHESRPPLLILGNSGSGKSALLANWLQRRQRNMTRSRAADDFVFWHAVGCTRQSMDVNNLMRRMMRDLKARFELSRDVPRTQARLSWDLPRFLELGSKKGKVIIVIDGLHRLDSSGGDTNLSWLPLEYPPNVRIIVSATLASNNDSDQSARRNHTIEELQRRKLQILYLKPLDLTMCRSVVESFIKRTVQSESSTLAGGSYLTERNPSIEHSPDIPGFLLFDNQIKDITTHRLGSNPLFLRILLRCIHWAVSRGYSLWQLLDKWLITDSIENLYLTILTCFELGYKPTKATIDSAKSSSIECGAMHALKTLYPWHPSFQKMDELNTTEMLAVDFQFEAADMNRNTQTQKLSPIRHGPGVTGGIEWTVASQQAEAKLEGARVDTQREMDSLVKRAKRLASEENITYIEAFLQIQQDALENQSDDDESEDENSTPLDDDSVLSMISEGDLPIPNPTFFITEAAEDGVPSPEPLSNLQQQIAEAYVIESINRALMNLTSTETISTSTKSRKSRNTTGTNSTIGEMSGIAHKKTRSNRFSSLSVPRSPKKIGKQHSMQIINHSTSTAAASVAVTEPIPEFDPIKDNEGPMTSDGSASRGTAGGGVGGGIDHSLVSNQSPNKQRVTSLLQHVDALDDKASPRPLRPEEDPKMTVNHLPMYFIGGVEVAGFGKILGHALALLYVARHGLKESELWSIIASLPRNSNGNNRTSVDETATDGIQKASTSSSRQKQPITDEMKALISVCSHYREKFRATWQSNDLLHTNRLSTKKLLVGMKFVNPEFTEQDLNLLLTILDCPPQRTAISKNAPTVNYVVLLERIIRAERVIKMENIRKKTKNSSTSDENSVNDLEDKLFTTIELGEEIDGYLSIEDLSADDSHGSLGPVMEEGLLSALCALGVLHSPKDQVIVLPCENEQLRAVILERYILADGGTLEEWHLRLIRFFEKKRNSLRRCEELPWHLKICRRWFNLKSFVSDLKSFKMMAEGELRDELLGYWFTLTHTPLYVTDRAEQEANNANRIQISENQRILSEIDSASVLHLNDQEIKKQLLKDCVANFDIVEEFDKSVEHWSLSEHPNASTTSAVILNISKFIAEFCRHYEVSPHPFLRLGMDKKCLVTFNVRLSDGLPANNSANEGSDTATATANNAAGTSNEPPSPNESNHSTIPIGSTLTLNLTKQEAHLYHYYRWLWIQFPWLAMPICSDEVANLSTSKGGSASKGHHEEITKASKSKEKIKVAMNKDGVIIQRSQSARIAAQNATTATANGKEVPVQNEKATALFPVMEYQLAPEEIKRREIASRSWQAKKQDPSMGRVVSASQSRTNALIKARLTPISDLDAIESFGKHSLDISHRLPSAEGPPQHQAYNKFRYPLSVHMKSLSNIPHSAPSVRSQKQQTYFPSVSTNHKEKKKRETHDGGGGCALTVLDDEDDSSTFEDELHDRHLNEMMKKLNQRGGSCIPNPTLEGVVAELELEKTGRLRAAFDKVHELRRVKQHQLDQIKSDTMCREDIDMEVSAAIHSADYTMNLLEDRYVSLQSALSEAKTVNHSYSKLISFLQVNPPSTENHMTALEQEVSLAKQQCQDIKQYRLKLYEETDKIEKISIKNIRDKLQKIKTQHQILHQQLKEQRLINQKLTDQLNEYSEHKAKKQKHILKMFSSDFNHDRKIGAPGAAIGGVLGEAFTRNRMKRHLDEGSTGEAIGSPDEGPRRGNSAEKKLTKFQIIARTLSSKKFDEPTDPQQQNLDELFISSLTTSPEDFVDIFKNSLTLHESMKSHQSLAESRISQLRTEEAELQVVLSDAAYVSVVDEKADHPSTSNSEREMRYLDQRLFKAEMRLNHNLRLTEKAVLSINEIRTGVVHISSLLAANESLLQNLPSSSPPILKSDNGIAKLLAWCEERVLAINEALVLDASKPVGVDDSKPLHTRQTELASLIQGMSSRKPPAAGSMKATSKVKKPPKRTQGGDISRTVLASADVIASQDISDSVAVRVVSEAEMEKIYEEKYDEALNAYNTNAEIQENAEKSRTIEDPREATLRLLSTAIQSQEASNALRRANILSNRKQGRNAGFGWTIEELLQDHSEATNPLKSSAEKRRLKKQTKLHSQTLSRQDMKQLSHSKTRSHTSSNPAEAEKKALPPHFSNGAPLAGEE